MEDAFHRAPLPVTREEFEGRAVLYHIMMDLEGISPLQKTIYRIPQ
ncbi:MAG: hypothetical protein ACLUL2_02690 [Blautia sp.]